MDVSVRIRHWRSEAGLTKTELANAVGVGQSSVTGYESGYQIPTIGTLAKICAVCGITMYEFWGPLKRKGNGGEATAA